MKASRPALVTVLGALALGTGCPVPPDEAATGSGGSEASTGTTDEPATTRSDGSGSSGGPIESGSADGASTGAGAETTMGVGASSTGEGTTTTPAQTSTTTGPGEDCDALPSCGECIECQVGNACTELQDACMLNRGCGPTLTCLLECEDPSGEQCEDSCVRGETGKDALGVLECIEDSCLLSCD